MTRTKRKKRLKKIEHKKTKLAKKNLAIINNAKKLDFKSAQEYKLFEALINEGIEVYHNIILFDEEIDARARLV